MSEASDNAAVRTAGPYLCVDDARAAVAFYIDVFGAEPVGAAYVDDDGHVGHAELQFGDTLVMLSEPYPEIDVRSPTMLGGTPVTLRVEVPDAAATVARGRERGATVEREVAEQFYGARSGVIRDPWGHRWKVDTPTGNPSLEEMGERSAAQGYRQVPTADLVSGSGGSE